MKVTIDTKEKTICIESNANLDEFYKLIEDLHIDPVEYTLVVNVEEYIYPPYTPSTPYPTWPFITYGTTYSK